MSEPTIRDAIASIVIGVAAIAATFAADYLAMNRWQSAIVCGIVAGLVGFAVSRRSQ